VVPLGFGPAMWSSPCPRRGSTSIPMADLDDVAADFGRAMPPADRRHQIHRPHRRFFAGHGIADYRIVESLGATEGAPASGAADLIVDITTTGTTLKANGLKISPMA